MNSENREKIIQELQEKLIVTIELEHSTIPPYLYAYWSVKDRSSETARVLLEVAKEEMMHMAMACNILHATGGTLKCNHPGFIPDYPCALPGHSKTQTPFIVGLRKLSLLSIVTFLEIERPRAANPLVKLNKPGTNKPIDAGWETIADFYMEITALIAKLDDSDFQKGRQLNNTDKPDNSGILFAVQSKADALKCVAEIIEQGEGFGFQDADSEESHFYRFVDIYRKMGGTGKIEDGIFNANELRDTYDKNVYAEFEKQIIHLVPNPREDKYSTEAYEWQNKRFNSIYSRMLDDLCSGMLMDNPEIGGAIKAMFALGRHADAIMSIPAWREVETAHFGPSFEYLEPGERI
ncbi:MAG: ferritin-like protein [Bacteroidetes bacterium]|nr:ferritin-like protein [Bacteroidota bacterium]